MSGRKFAVVTGASTGIGFELAELAAKNGYDLLIVADEAKIQDAAAHIRTHGADVVAIEADLATIEGVDKMLAAVNGPIDLLCANAGRGLGHGFLDQKVDDWRRVIDTNITGTLYLLQKVLSDMVARDDGKVLITGSIAGFIPGSFQAVYNGTKAFVDSFADAIRNELKDSKGVTITTLMPGPVETEFFKRGDMMDTEVGTSDTKSTAEDVAKDGWDAVMAGESHIVSGWKNKIQAAVAHVTPAAVLAEQHRKMAEPGTANS